MSTTPLLINNVEAQAHPAVLKEKLMASLVTGLLGVALIYGAGFAETSQLHNAAHDGRHSASFPCH